MDILLIRHARPHRITDPAGADPGLTPEGEDQARRLAKALSNGRYGRVARLVVSPMRRARETTEFVQAATDLDAHVEDRLAELDRGWTTYGVDLDAYPSRRDVWTAFNSGRLGGNTFDVAEFQARVSAGFADVIASAPGEPDDVTAVVCHGGVINVLLAQAVGASNPFFTEPFYTSVTRLRVDPDGHQEMLSLNEIDHLRD